MKQSLLIVVMGVSGSGKSTVAKALARRLKYEFVEADDFHSKENKQRMSSGLPLTDKMREPWVALIQSHLEQSFTALRNCVLSFSGLRRVHRAKIQDLPYKTIFIHLKGEQALIAQRLETRTSHFMPTSLLESQFSALESASKDETIFPVSIDKPLEKTIQDALKVIHEAVGVEFE